MRSVCSTRFIYPNYFVLVICAKCKGPELNSNLLAWIREIMLQPLNPETQNMQLEQPHLHL